MQVKKNNNKNQWFEICQFLQCICFFEVPMFYNIKIMQFENYITVQQAFIFILYQTLLCRTSFAIRCRKCCYINRNRLRKSPSIKIVLEGPIVKLYSFIVRYKKYIHVKWRLV